MPDSDYVLVARRPALTRRFAALVADVERAFAQIGRDEADRNRQRPAIMNSEDSRNLILAIALSVLVLIGWQYFFAAPQLQKDRAAQQQAQTQTQAQTDAAPGAAPTVGGAPALAPPGAPAQAAPKTRAEALAASPRVDDRHAEPRRLDRP